MVRAVIIIIVVTTYILKNVGCSEKFTYNILKMDKELTLDAHAKVRAIMHMRRYHSGSSIYHVGKTMCRIRQKYARMIFLYTKSHKMYESLTYNIHIGHLIEMQQLGWYIDNLVRMIEMWEEDEVVKDKQAKGEEEKKKRKEHSDRLRWQIHRDTRKIERQGDQKDKETNKYLDGFDSDFNR